MKLYCDDFVDSFLTYWIYFVEDFRFTCDKNILIKELDQDDLKLTLHSLTVDFINLNYVLALSYNTYINFI